ncbi:hypothetical protein [Thermostaphylospora chromogena]|uniref:Uncharacterized protein n=1 Tax=Thermostaphylospora chromogena TaxID=35622 RepID=A0A1H1AIC4_9ACTN|nr:hypothetical protein [Thermostaphylospora chromogena]SDQ39513.1 hypothetical protein SAMN04489764_0511 [Thermostaphylospora chromogena]
MKQEVAALRRDVERLRSRVDALAARRVPAAPDPSRTARWDEAHRLANETAGAMDRLLQNEVMLWQAVDRIDAILAAERSAAEPGAAGGERAG